MRIHRLSGLILITVCSVLLGLLVPGVHMVLAIAVISTINVGNEPRSAGNGWKIVLIYDLRLANI